MATKYTVICTSGSNACQFMRSGLSKKDANFEAGSHLRMEGHGCSIVPETPGTKLRSHREGPGGSSSVFDAQSNPCACSRPNPLTVDQVAASLRQGGLTKAEATRKAKAFMSHGWADPAVDYTPYTQAKRGKRGNPTLLVASNPTLLLGSNPTGKGRALPALPKRIQDDPAFQKALAKYRQVHWGSDPDSIVEVDVPKGTPKYLISFGKAPEVTYMPPRSSKKGNGPPFLHEFSHQPYLVTDQSGKYLGYVGLGPGHRVTAGGIHG